MDDRARNRLISNRAGRGAGSGIAAAQKVSRGLSDEEAELEAAEARKLAASGGFVAEVEEQQEEEKEVPPPDLEPPTGEETETMKKMLDLMRADTTPRRTQGYTDPLVEIAEKNRANIEAGLEPMSLSELLFHNYVTQTVPLFEDIEIELRSLKGHHFTLLDRWTLQKFGHLSLVVKERLRHFTAVALTIHRMDGKIPGGVLLPDEKNTAMTVDTLEPDPNQYFDVFKAKLNWIQQMDPSLIDLLCMHVTWFEQRKRRVVANHAYVGQQVKKS